MSTATLSRTTILDRIRKAGGSAPGRAEAYAALPRQYERNGSLDEEARLRLMIERLREYDSEVVECAPKELARTIAAELSRSGRHSLVAPEGMPGEWLAEGTESGTKFTGIELTDGEWYDYDEKAGEEVSVQNLAWEIRRA